MTMGDRLKNFRKNSGLSQKKVAEYLGITIGAYSHYENDSRELDVDKIKELSKLFGISGDELSDAGFQNPLLKEIIPMSGLPHNRVPILGAIQCGLPTLAEENIEEYANVADLRCDFALRCVGDSMAPTLLDGDLVLLRSQPDVTDGQIAAIRIGEEATLKHLRHTPTGIILIPENPDYPPLTYELSEDSDIAVIGLAIGLQRIIGRKP